MSGSNLPPAWLVQANGIGDISDAELNSFVQSGGLLANARAFVGISGMTINLIGLASPGDSGNGMFYWNASSTNTDDGGNTTIQPNGVLVGRWLRISGSTTASMPLLTNIAALRLLGIVPSGAVYVEGYFTGADGGEGVFWFNAADVTSTDNGGTIIVDAAGHRWYRETNGLPLSVKWFGAKGNGITDDTSAIQAAANAMPQGTALYFPAGTFLVSSTITIPTSVLSPNGESGGVLMYGDGWGASIITTAGTSVTLFSCQFTSGNAGFNLTIRDMSFTASSGSYNAWHITTQNIDQFVIERCIFWSTNGDPSAVAGVEVVGEVGVSDTFYCRIARCMFEGSSILLNGVTDSWIDHNVIFAEPPQAGATGRAYGVQLMNAATNIKIHDNHFGAAKNGSIYTTGTPLQLLALSIKNNFFDTHTTLLTAAAINFLNGVQGGSVVANTFSGVPGFAITASDMSFCLITENVFFDTGSGNSSFHTILLNKISTGCVNNIISHNVFRNTLSLSPPVAAIFENASSCSGNVYGPNVLSGTGYASQGVTFGNANGDAFLSPWTGMLTKNGGTVVIVSGTTSTTFSHGLAYEPSQQDFVFTNLAGWGSASKVFVAAVTATTCTISVDTNPGSNISFGWRVEYRGNINDA